MLAISRFLPSFDRRWRQRRSQGPAGAAQAPQQIRFSLRIQLLVGLGIGLATCLFSLLPIGRTLENKGYNLLFMLRGPLPLAEDIVVVTVDDASFTELRLQWPWPRSLHGKLVDRLSAAGVRVIAFDILFDQPSAASEDAAFAEAIARAGNVILAADRAVVDTPTVFRVIPIDPLPVIAKGAAGSGLVSQIVDSDKVIRRAVLAVDGQPTLALAIARHLGWQEPSMPSPFSINHHGPSPAFTSVSFSAALNPEAVPDAFFRGKIILVGRSQGSAGRPTDDMHFTPFSATGMATPGVEIHAAVLDTLLRRRPIHALPRRQNFLFILLWCSAASLVLGRLQLMSGTVVLGGLTIANLVFALTLFTGMDLWIAWVAPVFGMALLYVALLAARWLLSERERRKVEQEKAVIRDAFKHYLDPALVEEVIADPNKLQLGGKQVEATVLFSDLEGFTTIAERFGSPINLVGFLNQYFSAMTEIIVTHQGMLNRTIGDGILALWGVPVPLEKHALAACRGALAMQRRLQELNEMWGRDGVRELQKPLRMRIGIQTGEIVAGNVGSAARFEYSVLGDNVNTASRLEAIDKLYRAGIIIGEETARQVAGSLELRELDSIRVVGRTQPQIIFQCVGELGSLTPAQQDAYGEFQLGLQLYRRREWCKALEHLHRAIAILPEDGPSRVFVKRCQEYMIQSAPENWDGVYDAPGKQG